MNYKQRLTSLSICFFLLFGGVTTHLSAQVTYSEKLGWEKGQKVVIFHVDDSGMSYESNLGTIKSMEEGVATSCSVMMPCAWSGSFVNYALENPHMDVGVHLTLTSEWKDYRWEPLSGKALTPSLHDQEGAMWKSVELVVNNASPEEVYIEMKSQIDRAINLGLKPTHLDSHMGTLFAHEPFLEKYIQVGAEYGIPVMFPGGNNKLLEESLNYPIVQKLKAEGKYRDGMQLPKQSLLKNTTPVGQKIWSLGLPVLDDLHTISGKWKPEKENYTLEELGKHKVLEIKRVIETMEPGLLMVIVHCNEYSEFFDRISGSGDSRYADMLSMIDPDLKKHLEENNVILTTWREVMERRKKSKK
ncbi:polysaccharide deacetylase family protein [Belliella sp. R4-6]|uniref:Polysaccharide deacetylase family protein n=1 Tax=Belliella alkalica TaxID=1730871 RepID=A0ABS9VFR8_9BACT|nr:polysaccharide deacetylase family protein [Belliella alkalica]MCH7415266.1 polysaccharide deacetylase family protein [Belliella alkalica]